MAKKATKPVAKAKDKPKVKNDPLADLGLETTTPAQTAATTTAATEQTAAETDAVREEVEVGEIETGFIEYVPSAKRTSGGSKYKFDTLAKPSVFEDGPHKGKPKLAFFMVKLQEGVDADKLRRSVQSATTQANRQGEAEGKYFVSRSVTKDGKFEGMQVIRTDDRPKD